MKRFNIVFVRDDEATAAAIAEVKAAKIAAAIPVTMGEVDVAVEELVTEPVVEEKLPVEALREGKVEYSSVSLYAENLEAALQAFKDSGEPCLEIVSATFLDYPY